MKNVNKVALVVGSLAVAGSSYAVTAYDSITAAANWSDATTALGVVAAALALVLVFRKGAKMVLGFFGR